MDLKGLLGKLFKAGGKDINIGDLGLNVVIDKLQGLTNGADAGDKKSITDIIAIIKKALDDKGSWSKIVTQCIGIAKQITNGNLKDTVLTLLKTVGK